MSSESCGAKGVPGKQKEIEKMLEMIHESARLTPSQCLVSSDVMWCVCVFTHSIFVLLSPPFPSMIQILKCV